MTSPAIYLPSFTGSIWEREEEVEMSAPVNALVAALRARWVGEYERRDSELLLGGSIMTLTLEPRRDGSGTWGGEPTLSRWDPTGAYGTPAEPMGPRLLTPLW